MDVDESPTSWKRRAAAAAIAERCLAVVELTAVPPSRSLARAAVDALWGDLVGAGSTVHPTVSAATELGLDDPLGRAYLAQISLEPIEAAVTSDPGASSACGELAVDLFSEFDWIGSGSIVFQPRDLPASGPMEIRELAYQSDDQRLLNDGGSPEAIVEQLRERAEQARRELSQSLPPLIAAYLGDVER